MEIDCSDNSGHPLASEVGRRMLSYDRDMLVERGVLGKAALQVSSLGLGGVEITTASVAQVERLLAPAREAGAQVIETGGTYGNSENLIGQATAGRRNDFYLFTKCGHA